MYFKKVETFAISKRYNERYIGYNWKMQRLAFRNIVAILLYNRYFYSRTTKIGRFILGLRKPVWCMS